MIYPADAIVEIFYAGQWHPAAQLRALADLRCQFSYLDEYVFGGPGIPVSLRLPVGLWPEPKIEGLTGLEADHRPPPFLYDLIPQGRGRKFLLSALSLNDGDSMIMPLVMAGAFNPIGCIRLSTAVDFYSTQAAKNPSSHITQGFSLDDITAHSDEFLEHIALHAMLAAGTTGVQGVAPKFLLTTDAEGKWFADLALPDERACEHWLVKLARGKSEEDRMVLRNEAAYLRVAAACGLRVAHEPRLIGEMLFVRRFDRAVTPGGLQRLHQESLASLVGQRGFGVPHSQQALLGALRDVVDHPLDETIEFIKRDILNLALRNTDNHSRNTAVQRTPDGCVQLTPLFDFAPMFKDPEIVARSCHWRNAQGTRQTDWLQIIEGLALPEQERIKIVHALSDFLPLVSQLEDIARQCGVEPAVLNQCLGSIAEQSTQLARLPTRSRLDGPDPDVTLGDRHG
jgi:serine/threonine-protein kinase HipA